MKNETFSNLSEVKKRNKLMFILKEKTKGCLNDAEVASIIDGVKLKCQYIIKLHFSVASFEEILVKPKMGDGKVIVGSAVFANERHAGSLKERTSVAAVIIRKPYSDTENTIHIYIPPGRTTRGRKSKQEPMILCDQKCVDEKFICHHIEYRKDQIFCEFDPPKEVNKHA